MTIYVITVQGRFIDVTRSKVKADKIRENYYMGGHDGVAITIKEV